MIGRISRTLPRVASAVRHSSTVATRSNKSWVLPAASATLIASGAAAHTLAQPGGCDLDCLKQQNSQTSGAVISLFNDNSKFVKVSKFETDAILTRDAEDDFQLAKGIKIAVDKGVIPAEVEVEDLTKVDVMGKTADAVAKEIIAALGPAAESGCVLTLEGLSGTGKGTTVARLKSLLPRATTWSNGNIFRSLTLLAVTYSEQQGVPLAEALTAENLDKFVKMLHFGKYSGKFDVLIDGLGHKAFVSEIQNTTLKSAKVGKNIPTVAGVTQGEVINFVKDALNQMSADGISVLLEGRAQTLNYIRTPHRFELVLSDELLIGKRRAAQKMMAAAMKDIGDNQASDQQVRYALARALDQVAEETS